MASVRCAQVVISDFPDPALVNNLAKNVEMNVTALEDEPRVAEATAKVSAFRSTSSRRVDAADPCAGTLPVRALLDSIHSYKPVPDC